MGESGESLWLVNGRSVSACAAVPAAARFGQTEQRLRGSPALGGLALAAAQIDANSTISHKPLQREMARGELPLVDRVKVKQRLWVREGPNLPVGSWTANAEIEFGCASAPNL